MPEPEETIQKQLPEDALILKMSVTISSDGDSLAQSSGAEDKSAEATESAAVGTQADRASAFDVSVVVNPWRHADTERALAGIGTLPGQAEDATG